MPRTPRRPWGLNALVLAAGLVLPCVGGAQSEEFPNDIRLYQLGNPCPTSQRIASPARPCEGRDANDRFAALVNELAVSISSFNLQPPETTGPAGFDLSFEYAVVMVNKTAQIGGKEFWQIDNPARARDQPLLIPMAHFRKGVPFPPVPGLRDVNLISMEIGGRAGWISGSHMAFGMIETKLALNEGFTYVPDLGVRGYVSRLIGASQFDVTAAGFDIGLGKQFAVGGMLTLTPYLGWNIVWAAGTSNVVDFFPERQKWGKCTQADVDSGVCRNVGEVFPYSSLAKATDATNVFDEVYMANNFNNRFYGGLRFVTYIVELGAEVSYAKVQGRDLWAINGKVGLDF